MTRKPEINPVLVVAAVLGLSAAIPDFFKLKANRLVTGDGIGFFQSLDLPVAVLLLISWLACAAAAVYRNSRLSMYGVAGLSFVTLVLLVPGAGIGARNLLSGAPELTRVSPSGGFWLSALAVYLLYFAASRPGQPARTLITASGPLIVVAAAASGLLNGFSFVVEYQNQSSRFFQELLRHLLIFGVSIGAAIVIGLPTGIIAAKSRFAAPVLYLFGVIQTIPSLALFGLLLVALSALRQAIPGLGISGIGLLPAIIAITLYSLLPIAQNTFSGIKGVAKDIRDAGAGIGMSSRQLLLKVEMPLAAPTILSGLRIAAVQAVGGTAVAALIGAGGLGFFIFQGLEQAASDLILMGAISVVVLALVINGIFQFLEERLKASLPGMVTA
ncbi:osmoprotectant transport system permease protein [Dehalogenimonas formicexedens]|uniref:Osmoprotectant transport system permease protein n=1 Tax=Dehalogenimonas formicexedens TaxID=1839801 RepID=A0A1P8F8C1_9CHLR|nr:ABC transporter permease [Dehalogenimonas formicexedens]APV44726.1 osmoprotectant transport system permease protein [Dehalogenimonas formicexedens]